MSLQLVRQSRKPHGRSKIDRHKAIRTLWLMFGCFLLLFASTFLPRG